MCARKEGFYVEYLRLFFLLFLLPFFFLVESISALARASFWLLTELVIWLGHALSALAMLDTVLPRVS